MTRSFALNNSELPENTTPIIDGWLFALDEVPTGHLNPLFRHYLKNKTEGFQITVKDLMVEWNNRYESDSGKPPPGMSWERDEHGKFTIPSIQTNGRLPFGASNIEEAKRLNEQARQEWEHNMLQSYGNEVSLEEQIKVLEDWR